MGAPNAGGLLTRGGSRHRGAPDTRGSQQSAVSPLRSLTLHVGGAACPTVSDWCLFPKGLTLAEVTGLRAPVLALPLSSSPPRHQQSSKNISLICKWKQSSFQTEGDFT